MKFRMKNENGEEFEFEGDEKSFSAVVGQLANRLFDPSRPRQHGRSGSAIGSKGTSDPTTPHETMTTTAIAVRLRATRGPDLFVAAATKLTFYDGKESFTRSDVLKEMRSATSFFTENHRKNLSKYVRQLIADKRLNERAKDLYVLAMETRTEMARKLGIRLPQ
jgi:hypothetical protein